MKVRVSNLTRQQLPRGPGGGEAAGALQEAVGGDLLSGGGQRSQDSPH